jgi:hypothetical protein
MAEIIRYFHTSTRQALHTETAMFTCIVSFLLTCLFWVPMIKLSNPIPLTVVCVLSGLFWGRMYVGLQRKGYLFFPPTKSYRNELGNFAQGVLALMAFFGFLIVGVAIESALYNASLLLFGQNAYGLVTRQEEEWKNVEVKPKTSTSSAVHEKRLFYYAIVEINVDEQTYEIKASTAGAAPRYPTGSEVEILYLSGNPDKGRIKREVQSPWGESFLALFGVVIIGAACFTMFIQGAWRVPEPISAWFRTQVEKRCIDMEEIDEGNTETIADNHEDT